jgi:hypothetical protein
MTTQPTPSAVEQLAPGVTLEWILDGKACMLTSQDSARETVDIWMARSMEMARDWPDNQPILLAIDATNPNVAYTPYQRARLKEMRNLRPDLNWYIAFVSPKTYLMNLLQMGAMLSTGRRQIRIFFEREKAVEWLAAQLK